MTKPYDNKKLKIDTPSFRGYAHIRFEKPIGTKHDTDEYRVVYRGAMQKGDGLDDEGNEELSTHRLVVRNGRDGQPYNHDIDGRRSKNIVDLLRKCAPTWIDVSQLRPR